jgi:hypothetical protein
MLQTRALARAGVLDLPPAMPDDRIAFAKPFRIEEWPSTFRIVDATGRHTGIVVFFSGFSTLGGQRVKMPSEEQARDMAEAIVKALK